MKARKLKETRVKAFYNDVEIWWKLMQKEGGEAKAKACYIGRNLQKRAWRILG